MRTSAAARDQAYQARGKYLADLERRELTLLAESAGWPRWAAVAAHFPLFRAGDHVMVLGQRPQAQLLLSPQQWRDGLHRPRRRQRMAGPMSRDKGAEGFTGGSGWPVTWS